MTAKLRLGPIADDKPVKLAVELPASLHADLALYARLLADAGDAPITFTLSSQINFLTTAKGEYLTAEARAVRKGRRTSFYAAEIRDELGTLIATVSSNGFRMDR